jgi:hypothetical protein
MTDTPPAPGWWLASDGRWYPPEQHPAPTYQPHIPPPTVGAANSDAIASLVLGILWLGGIGSVIAIVLGIRARREIDRSYGRQSGRGQATAGIVLGWIGVVGAALCALLITLGITSGFFADFNSMPPDGHCDDSHFWQDSDC